MNDEEKQAVEKMQYILDLINKNEQYTADEKDIKHIIVITNLIIKYQKEIEELSVIKNSIQTLETHFVNDDTYYVIAKKNFLEGDFRHLLDDYISKDEIRHIRDKAECMDYYSLNDVIDDLSKLLGDKNNE